MDSHGVLVGQCLYSQTSQFGYSESFTYLNGSTSSEIHDAYDLIHNTRNCCVVPDIIKLRRIRITVEGVRKL
jgi:hypothetical protein